MKLFYRRKRTPRPEPTALDRAIARRDYREALEIMDRLEADGLVTLVKVA